MNEQDKMKIIQVSFGRYPLPYDGVGGDTTIFYLADALGEINDCEVNLIDLKSSIHKDIKVNFKYREVFGLKVKSESVIKHALKMIVYAFSSALKIFKINLKQGIDIVHLHNQFPASAVIILKKIFKLKFKTVYTVHNAAIFISSPKYYVHKPLENYVFRNVDHIIATTPFVKNFLIDKLKIDGSKISQIYLGLELNRINDFITNNKKSASTKNVIYVASVSKRKNQMAVVKAMEKVFKNISDAKCVFVGNIEEQSYYLEIMKYAREKGIENRIVFLGGVHRLEMYRHLLNAEISVITSIHETQGLVLVEAMAFGLPVIASMIEPFKNVIDLKPGSAILVDSKNTEELADNIIKLFNDNSLRKELSDTGKQLVEQFSWANIALKVYSVYKRLGENNV